MHSVNKQFFVTSTPLSHQLRFPPNGMGIGRQEAGDDPVHFGSVSPLKVVKAYAEIGTGLWKYSLGKEKLLS